MKKLIFVALLAMVVTAPAFGWGKHHPPKPLHKNAPHPYTKHQATKHPKTIHPHRVS